MRKKAEIVRPGRRRSQAPGCEPLEPRCLLSASTAFRPPAVPLVTADPYLSIWSEADHLTDDVTRHWTGVEQSLVSLIRVDGQSYRLMGDDPSSVPALPQLSVQVLPTRTIYSFANPKVSVTLTFTRPALPGNLDVLSWPLTYLTWDVRSVDGAAHAVSIYDSTSSELAVNTTDQAVVWGRQAVGNLTALRVGTQAQTFFQPAGDATRIDWGYAYAAAESGQAQGAIGNDQTMLADFIAAGTLPAADDPNMPRAVSAGQPVMAFAFNLGAVGTASVSRHMMIAYDEINAIKYFGEPLLPYWKRNGASAADLLQAADTDYASLQQQCQVFDQQLMNDLTQAGGLPYAQMTALAYRQALAGTGIAADANGQPLVFTKENTSNGDIATVDVIYPMEPVLLLLCPSLAKAALVPDLAYAASGQWTAPYAPHDLGTYPIATGYPNNGGEQQPVEESGNMLILCDAIAHVEGSAEFASQWWPQLTQWAQYLQQYGVDPGDQLSTDDFLGPVAHNANLAVKAIEALGAYGDLARMLGDSVDAAAYTNMAQADAQHWMQVDNDGNHYRLAFDQPNTWSQLYNLVWDRILGLNLFPATVAQAEVAYYKTVMQPYGLPLDSQVTITKTDWSVWTATLATSTSDFQALIAPAYNYLNQTTSRQPLADAYDTTDLTSSGFHARPVVGGLFIKMLSDPVLWAKWSSQDHAQVGNWAALPTTQIVVPSAPDGTVIWHYTTQQPPASWTSPGFNDAAWSQGPAGFGTAGTPGAVIGTTWNTPDIWLRRTFTMPSGSFPNLKFWVYHDEDVEIYVNGVLAASEAGYVPAYETLDINPAARALLTPGATITLAVHCHQTVGGQDIDVGLVNTVIPANPLAVVSGVTAFAANGTTIPLHTAADGVRLLADGRAVDLPISGVRQIQLTLSRAVALAASDVRLAGTAGVNYGPITLSGSGTTYLITLARPITTADQLTITLAHAGVATFNRRLDVLPGDANDDGRVDVVDLGILSTNFGKAAGEGWAQGDFTGDGAVDVVDLGVLATDFGASLPIDAAGFTAVPQPAASSGPATAAPAAMLVMTDARRRLTSPSRGARAPAPPQGR